MSQTFNLPDVGEGLTEAEIVSWKVAPGDTVAINDVICEIETAKSLVELPVPYAGTVEQLVAEEGETIEVGQPLIRIGAAEGAEQPADSPVYGKPPAGDSSSSSESKQKGGQKKAQSATDDTQKALVGSGPKADAPKARTRTRPASLDLVEVPGFEAGEAPPRGPGFPGGEFAADIVQRASPPVRALAKRLGVAVWELVGSGRNGQITRDDVERQAKQRKAQREAGRVPPSGPPSPSGGAPAPGQLGLLYDGPREEKVQVRGVRKATALNVTASASTVPHVSVFKEIDVTRTMELRSALRESQEYQGLSVSPLLFAAKAIIWAARRNPQVNATWHDTHYTLHNYVNLGVAAATPRGLVVPVIHEAHTYNTRGLAAAITALTTDAREGKTTPAEMQGGTVSITSIGSLGLDFGTPILPPGQASIVMLGAVRTKPWVVDGQVVPRQVATVGGSFDHRLIDGDLAGAFVSDIAAVLEQPGLLLD